MPSITTSRSAKIVAAPGSSWDYNNAAVDFLARIVQVSSGQSLDAFLESRLFSELGISGADWMKDKAGVPRAAGELLIRPVDLAKIGQLMLQNGTWNGEQIVPSEWIEKSIRAQGSNQFCGYLWWLCGPVALSITESTMRDIRQFGLEADEVEKLEKLVGVKFPDLASLNRAIGSQLTSKLEVKGRQLGKLYMAPALDGQLYGYFAQGFLGQYLVVLPGERVVGVRMRQGIPFDYDGGPSMDTFSGFPSELYQAVKAQHR